MLKERVEQVGRFVHRAVAPDKLIVLGIVGMLGFAADSMLENQQLNDYAALLNPSPFSAQQIEKALQKVQPLLSPLDTPHPGTTSDSLWYSRNFAAIEQVVRGVNTAFLEDPEFQQARFTLVTEQNIEARRDQDITEAKRTEIYRRRMTYQTFGLLASAALAGVGIRTFLPRRQSVPGLLQPAA